MSSVDGSVTSPDGRGIIQGNGGAVDKLAGGSGSDKLQGHADYNQYYGGAGNDTFILSAKFGHTTDAPTRDFGSLASYVTDFHGQNPSGEHDFISLSGFGLGSTLEQIGEATASPSGGSAKIYHYSIFDTHTGEYYNFMVNSVNGTALGRGDFAFYGSVAADPLHTSA